MATQIQTFDGSITDETARILWRAVEAAPEDMLVKGVLADRLDEIGEWPFLSGAFRWCMRRGKYPRSVSDGHRLLFGWVREGDGENTPHHIPRPVFDEMGGADANRNAYIAYLGIASALRQLHEIID
jgi:hypothetical protein